MTEPPIRPYANRRVLLGVAGGIASYKTAWLARLLTQAGDLVDGVLAVVLQKAGDEFILHCLHDVCFACAIGTQLDSHQGAVLLFDTENGSLTALLDATAVTTIRTAAVSGLATRLLARPDADELAILGAGVQGHAHLEAINDSRLG